MAAPTGYFLYVQYTVAHRHVLMGGWGADCRNVHNCYCALKTSGFACNLFYTTLVINPLWGFAANIHGVLECSLKCIRYPDITKTYFGHCGLKYLKQINGSSIALSCHTVGTAMVVFNIAAFRFCLKFWSWIIEQSRAETHLLCMLYEKSLMSFTLKRLIPLNSFPHKSNSKLWAEHLTLSFHVRHSMPVRKLHLGRLQLWPTTAVSAWLPLAASGCLWLL